VSVADKLLWKVSEHGQGGDVGPVVCLPVALTHPQQNSRTLS